MIQDWIVHITPTTSGQKIFEKCDLQSYSEKRKEYDLLTKTEKSGYKAVNGQHRAVGIFQFHTSCVDVELTG